MPRRTQRRLPQDNTEHGILGVVVLMYKLPIQLFLRHQPGRRGAYTTAVAAAGRAVDAETVAAALAAAECTMVAVAVVGKHVAAAHMKTAVAAEDMQTAA